MANAVIFQNVADVSRVLHELIAEGYQVKREDVAALSPYLTRHIKGFGDYFIDLSAPPQSLSESALSLSFYIERGKPKLCPIFTGISAVPEQAPIVLV